MILPSFTAEFDTRGIDRAFVALEREIEREMHGVFLRHGQRIAGAARANHVFQNQTSDLEGSIDGLPPSGAVFDGTLQGGVVALMPYASYLEGHPDFGPGIQNGRFQFLAPAALEVEPYWEQDAETALESAVVSAGLR